MTFGNTRFVVVFCCTVVLLLLGSARTIYERRVGNRG